MPSPSIPIPPDIGGFFSLIGGVLDWGFKEIAWQKIKTELKDKCGISRGNIDCCCTLSIVYSVDDNPDTPLFVIVHNVLAEKRNQKCDEVNDQGQSFLLALIRIFTNLIGNVVENSMGKMCQTVSNRTRILCTFPCLNAVFLFMFFLLCLCACEQDKKQHNSSRESNITPDFPMPVICDDVFLESEQLSTPEEFIERFGNLSPENTWYLHPESKLSNGLLYWCQFKVGDDIVFPKCGLLIMFETNGLAFSFDSWTVHLQDMNIQSSFLPLKDLRKKCPLVPLAKKFGNYSVTLVTYPTAYLLNHHPKGDCIIHIIISLSKLECTLSSSLELD